MNNEQKTAMTWEQLADKLIADIRAMALSIDAINNKLRRLNEDALRSRDLVEEVKDSVEELKDNL